MSTSHLMSEEQRNRILEDSARKNLRSVLTYRDPSGWRSHKCHFIEAQSGHRRLIARIDEEREACRALPAPGTTLGVAFRLGHKKCMFSTVLHGIEDGSSGLIATLGWPMHLDQVQRRAYERVAPPEHCVVAVRFWPVSESQASPPRLVRHGQLQDLSAGGLRLKASESTDVSMGATYQCVFAPRTGAPAFVLEAVLRHRESAESGRVSLGFQFLGLETTAEGRKLLHRLARTVSQFQRARSRPY